MIVRTFLFLVFNFLALAVGGFFTGQGVVSSWYQELEKAPWTPPGWVFGAAWTTIMICYAFYMAYLWGAKENKSQILLLFALQWILNVAWNPVFFYYHNVLMALLIIVSLTVLMGFFFFYFLLDQKYKSLFVLPYFIWLLIATSLNAFILLRN
jgi:tryptophan-rich sensory protein